jgi:hypothetical protein
LSHLFYRWRIYTLQLYCNIYFELLGPTSTETAMLYVAFVCKCQVCIHLTAIRNMQCGSGHIQLCSLAVGCFSTFTSSYISVHVDQQIKFLCSWHSMSSRHVTSRHTIGTFPPFENLCPHFSKISYATISVYR